MDIQGTPPSPSSCPRSCWMPPYLPSISIGTDSIGEKNTNVKRQNKFIIFRLCIMISALGLFKFKAVHHMFWRKTNSEFLLSKAVERLHTRLDITMQPLIQHIFTKIIDFYFYLSKGFSDFSEKTFESIICCNDEFSLLMSWVGCLLKDSELLILFAENSQILLKISVIPILLTFMYYLVALSLLVRNQTNSSLRQIIDSLALRIKKLFFSWI